MKVGIVGANGQVGQEVSLFLSVMGVEVIPISRAGLGGVFLERCGLGCRYGSIGDVEDAKEILEGCDLVADFAHPHGLPGNVRRSVKKNIHHAIQYSPAGCLYVYISTISAFGMPPDGQRMKNYFLSHTRYSADKRYLERYALSQQKKRDIYVLRLGQVHGELQTVSHEFMEEIGRGEVCLPFHSNTGSYTVFCYSIAEALINIAQRKERPGRYSLISTPPWSWGEVYSYWATRLDVELRLLNTKTEGLGKFTYSSLLSHLPFLRLATSYRELILNYLLASLPNVQRKVQAEFLRRKAIAEIRRGGSKGIGRIFQIGEVPGERLINLSDSRLTMGKATQAVREIIKSAEPCFSQE